MEESTRTRERERERGREGARERGGRKRGRREGKREERWRRGRERGGEREEREKREGWRDRILINKLVVEFEESSLGISTFSILEEISPSSLLTLTLFFIIIIGTNRNEVLHSISELSNISGRRVINCEF